MKRATEHVRVPSADADGLTAGRSSIRHVPGPFLPEALLDGLNAVCPGWNAPEALLDGLSVCARGCPATIAPEALLDVRATPPEVLLDV